ncbi:hypothetical protein Tco_1247507 [Tanacetum coccineum]
MVNPIELQSVCFAICDNCSQEECCQSLDTVGVLAGHVQNEEIRMYVPNLTWILSKDVLVVEGHVLQDQVAVKSTSQVQWLAFMSIYLATNILYLLPPSIHSCYIEVSYDARLMGNTSVSRKDVPCT